MSDELEITEVVIHDDTQTGGELVLIPLSNETGEYEVDGRTFSLQWSSSGIFRLDLGDQP